MTSIDRHKNAEIYLNDIGKAISGLVERCGGNLDDQEGTIPEELIIHQRSLFVHSGIIGLLSSALMDRDFNTIKFFDWLLGYHVSKDQGDQENQDIFITSMLTALDEQISKSYPNRKDPRFVQFLKLYRLSVMTLGGFVSPEEFSGYDEFFEPLAERYLARKAEERRKDAEKN
jgi:hypothetical protein